MNRIGSGSYGVASLRHSCWIFFSLTRNTWIGSELLDT